MLKNYIKIAYRNLLKNKVFSLVNIFGLAIGMAACLLILQYVRFEQSYEDFHKNSENIYRITIDLYKGSELIDTDCGSYGPEGPLLKDQLPEVQNYVRLYPMGMTEVKVGDKQFYEHKLYFADSSISKVFTLHAIEGDLNTALDKPFQSIITESIAKKYFGNTEVVGKSMDINHQPYQISAVIQDLPPNTHLKFDYLVSRLTLNNVKKWYLDYPWDVCNEYTYLLMAPGTDLNNFNQKLANLPALQENMTDEKVVAQPMRDIHLYSHKMFELEPNGDAKTVYFLLVIGLFIIFIAWINYVNLSTARAVERAREVGIRKVLGSVKRQLIQQFILESVLINLLAMTAAITLVQLTIPVFHTLTGLPISQLDADPVFWILSGALLAIGVILSGTYPAFVLSSFRPVTVLKGKFRSSSHGYLLRKGLVIFQFAATVILIAGTLGVYLQIKHLRKQDLGMDLNQKLVLRAPSLENASDSAYNALFSNFGTELLRNPKVSSIARSSSLPGLGLEEMNTRSSVTRVGQDKKEGSYTYYNFDFDANFIPTFHMQLVAGKQFSEGLPNNNQVIINEEAVRALDFESPEKAVGEHITWYTSNEREPSTVIGVLKNFSLRSPKEPSLPMVLAYTQNANYLTLELNTSDIQPTMQSIEKTWDQFFPESPLSYFFLNDQYNQQYHADVQFGNISTLFASLTILIACLGLFGLSSFTILQRTKEIGIRKTLGASVMELVNLLSKDFIKLVLIASIVALPLAYFALQEWLSQYATRIQPGWWLFIIPVGIVLFIALVTISFQTIRTATMNPAKSLRYE